MIVKRKIRLSSSWLIVPIVTLSLWMATSLLRKKEDLVLAKPMTVLNQQLPVKVPQPPSNRPKLILQGKQISLNGRVWQAAWSQWQIGTSSATIRTAISDIGLMRIMGVDLLSTWNFNRQPVQWFSQPEIEPLMLSAWLTNQYRYLDISDLAMMKGWQIKVDGKTLRITSPEAMVREIRQGKQAEGKRIVLDLNGPTPWQVTQEGALLTLKVDAIANPMLLERYIPKVPDGTNPINGNTLSGGDEENEIFPIVPPATVSPSEIVPLKLQSNQNQTTIELQVPNGLRAKVWSLPAPYRLVIDLAPEVMIDRDIMWAPGLRYRQQMVRLGDSRFPVVCLEINLRQSVKLRPIWSKTDSLVGITPLVEMAQHWQAAGAVNGGFFNRNTQLPLGAVRRDGQWISSPILNRGAIAWNDNGDVKIGHLSLLENLITSTGERLPIVSVNSGYVQPGIAVLTRNWGKNYTPLTDRETLVTVQNNQVTLIEKYERNPPPEVVNNKTSFSIPPDGYLLAFRNYPEVPSLTVGSTVRLENYPVPLEFQRYPHILGAGPVLLLNNQIVLDGKAEQFRDAFIQQSAYRSTIARTASNTILIATVGSRTGGLGPTLNEIAQIMKTMGAVDALNLDGGSSTSLYLGGELLNRSPRTAARVHNGLGIFLPVNP